MQSYFMGSKCLAQDAHKMQNLQLNFPSWESVWRKEKEKIAVDAPELFLLSNGDEKHEVREGAASGKLTIPMKRTQISEILSSAVLQR
ncbi:uncharacterized protein DS421_1g10330 [Arachis hypogaea]|nr:uncharacterized protein DS421_1g10330 [Arachis hypogaea]